MKSIHIMKPIDKLVLQGVDKLSATNEYQRFMEIYNSWEDNLQSLFKAGMVFILFLIPSLVIMLFYFLHSSAKTDYSIALQIIQTAQNINSKSSQVERESRNYLGQNPITTKSIFERELSSTLPSRGVDTTKIQVGNFSINEINGMNETSGELKFRGLSSDNLFGFLNVLSLRLKMKIDEINIKKNTQTNLLEGTLSVLHYSKIRVLDEE